MRAAGMAIPYECPKLAVTYQATEQDFATLLDQRIERMKLVEQAKTIDAKPVKENGGNANARLPPPISDRRYRRI
jgi:hypothetical protein